MVRKSERRRVTPAVRTAACGAVLAGFVSLCHAAGVALFDPKQAVSSEQAKVVLDAAQMRNVVQASWDAKTLMVVPLNLAAIDSNVITVPLDGTTFDYAGGPKRCDARLCVWRGTWGGTRGELTLALEPGGAIGGRLRHLGRQFEISGTAGSRYQIIKEMAPPAAAPRAASGAPR